MFVGLHGLYAILVGIAGCQLEKLRANLLSIGEGPVTTAQEAGVSPGPEEMQNLLNDCIRHHQIIKLYVSNIQQCL